MVFGHWAALEGKGTPEGIYGLDAGCCWGGDLTCLRWEDKTYFVQPSNRQLDLGKARQSPPENKFPLPAGRGSIQLATFQNLEAVAV